MLTIPSQNTIINKDEILANVQSKDLVAVRKLALELMEKGIEVANPQRVIKENLSREKNNLIIGKKIHFEIINESKIFVIGMGKASAKMAQEIENILGEKLSRGIVCVPEQEMNNNYNLQKIELIYAGHPLVNKNSIIGAKKILDLLEDITEKDIIICLISGGGSALFEYPLDRINEDELAKMFSVLTQVGATIHELNIFRKHFSQVKGGKLALHAQPAQVISLIISDVVGNDLETIASGPTAPDSSTWIDVKKIVEKYNLQHGLPEKILELIDLGLKGEIEETVKKDNPIFKRVWNIIIASNEKSCEEMEKLALEKGLYSEILSTKIVGEARIIGKEFIQKLKESRENTVIIAGGETTVTIIGTGVGGRNQELVLSVAEHISKNDNIFVAAIGTDGKDGPTNAAGAFVDKEIIGKGKILELKINEFLNNNDSYSYFNAVKGLIITGHTGTNVMDLIIGIKMK